MKITLNSFIAVTVCLCHARLLACWIDIKSLQWHSVPWYKISKLCLLQGSSIASLIDMQTSMVTWTTIWHWILRIMAVQVGYSAILFYGYVGIIGFAMFAVLRWGFKSQTTLVQTWCAYGEVLYSAQIFWPIWACQSNYNRATEWPVQMLCHNLNIHLASWPSQNWNANS